MVCTRIQIPIEQHCYNTYASNQRDIECSISSVISDIVIHPLSAFLGNGHMHKNLWYHYLSTLDLEISLTLLFIIY